jgi:hypothetical protein
MTDREDDIGIGSKIAVPIVNALVACAVPQLPRYKPVAGWDVAFFVAAILPAATAAYFALRDDLRGEAALIIAVIVTIAAAIAYPAIVSGGGITMPMLYVAVTVYAVMFAAASYAVARLFRFLIRRVRSLQR